MPLEWKTFELHVNQKILAILFCAHPLLTMQSPPLPIPNSLHMKLHRYKKILPYRVIVSLVWYKNFEAGLLIQASRGGKQGKGMGASPPLLFALKGWASSMYVTGSHQW